MKESEANDAYRRLEERKPAWKSSVAKLSVNGYRMLSALEIDFVPSVNVLVGANGSGKSRVLAALYEGMNADEAELSGVVRVELGAEFEGRPRAILVNASETTEFYRSYFRLMQDVESNLLNGIDPASLASNEIGEINYILCRNYKSVLFYETEPGLRVSSIDDGVPEYSTETVPYFVVSDESGEWDVRSMGSGEYAALYIWWHLRSATAGVVYLIEEPETHLSYRVQDRLCDHIAKVAWDKRVSILITTHSFPFVSKFPQASVSSLLRHGAGAKLSRKTKAEVLAHLGTPLSLRGLFVTEDRFAKFFLESFLDTFFPAVRSRIAVSYVGGAHPKPVSGATGIAALLEAVRHVARFPLVVAGVYDGDQASENSFTSESLKNSHRLLLPGEQPLDRVFTDVCRAVLSETTAIHSEFPAAFDRHEGLNFHDHLRKVSEDLDVSIDVIWRFCFHHWLVEKERDVAAFRADLDGLLRAMNI